MSNKKKVVMKSNEDTADNLNDGVLEPVCKNIVTINKGSVPLKDIGELKDVIISKIKNRLINAGIKYDTHKDIIKNIENDETIKRFIYKNTLFVLIGDSKLCIEDHHSKYYFDDIDCNESINNDGYVNIIILYNTTLDLESITSFKGEIYILNSKIKCEMSITLANAYFFNSTIKTENINVSDTTISDSYFISKNVIIKDSYFNYITLNVNDAIIIKNYITANNSSRISIYNNVDKFNLAPNHSVYSDGLNFPYYISSKVNFDINIVSRLDYGSFSALNKINFIRCNDHDLLIDNRFIDNKIFSKAIRKLRIELNDNPKTNVFEPLSFDTTDVLTASDYKEMKDNIIGLTFNKPIVKEEDYPTKDNHVKCKLVLGLIEQIEARINFYKQLNFLLG